MVCDRDVEETIGFKGGHTSSQTQFVCERLDECLHSLGVDGYHCSEVRDLQLWGAQKMNNKKQRRKRGLSPGAITPNVIVIERKRPWASQGARQCDRERRLVVRYKQAKQVAEASCSPCYTRPFVALVAPWKVLSLFCVAAPSRLTWWSYNSADVPFSFLFSFLFIFLQCMPFLVHV